MHVLNKGAIPIYSYIPPHEIESGAIDQATNAANHPHASQRVVLLPDVHHGYGVPIGSVVAFKDHVCPAAVGYDIGCGLVALKSDIEIPAMDRAKMTKVVMNHIRKNVPLGKGGRREKPLHNALPELPDDPVPMVMRQLGSAPVQLGTLGGGK